MNNGTSKNFKQELFDKVTSHLLTQNKACVWVSNDENNGCFVYRNKKGDTSPIGFLITIDNFTWSLNEYPSESRQIKKALLLSLGKKMTQDEMMLLDNLQYIHDQYSSNEWSEQFSILAKCSDLIFDEKVED